MAPRTKNKAKPQPKPSTLTFGPVATSAGASTSRKSSRALSQFHATPTLSTQESRVKTAKRKVNINQNIDDQLWVNQYMPETEEELAVHKKKLGELKGWLAEAFDDQGRIRKYRRILALTGPAGAGKTASLTAIAKDMGIQIVEWRNSMDEGYDEDNPGSRESLSAKFQNFLTRSSSYAALDFAPGPSTPSQTRRLILVEDFPNLQHAPTKEAFHSALENFVHSLAASSCPLVLIMSDAGTRGEADTEGGARYSKGRNDSLDIRTVLPKSLEGSPYVVTLPFNPIAVTYLRRAVPKILDKHFATHPDAKRPPKDLVDAVLEGSHGDIRSAIMTLQFACVVDLPGSGKVSNKKADRIKREQKTKNILETITNREQSLGLFHALGKILYNKRYGDDPDEHDEEGPPPLIPTLPDHHAAHTRRPSKVDLNVLYTDSPVDASMMSLYVHQNYTQFCDEIEHADDLMDSLSISDIFLSGIGEMWTHHATFSQYSFNIMAAGALDSLPSPVIRRNQKTTKSEWFDVLKRTRQAEEEAECHRTWLVSQSIRDNNSKGGSGSGGGTRWGTEHVAIELGKVLSLGLPDSGNKSRPLYTMLDFAEISIRPSSNLLTPASEHWEWSEDDAVEDPVQRNLTSTDLVDEDWEEDVIETS